MFVTRLLSGIVLVLIELVTLYFSGIPLAAFLLFISLVGYLEITKTMQVRKASEKLSAFEIIGLIGIVAYYLVMYFTGFNSYLVLVGMATFLIIMSTYVFGFSKFHATQVAPAIMAFVYVPVCLSFIYATRELEFGIYIVWLILMDYGDVNGTKNVNKQGWVRDSKDYWKRMLELYPDAFSPDNKYRIEVKNVSPICNTQIIEYFKVYEYLPYGHLGAVLL